MERRKEVRLENIAKEVGVSIVTVSNALKGKKGVSEELRNRIKETAVSMGYQMPEVGEEKTVETTYCVNVVVAERYVKEFPSFYMDIYKLAAQEISRKGNLAVLEVVNEEKEKMPYGFSGFLNEDIDGIIIIGEMSRDYVAAIRKAYAVPIVCVDYYDVIPDMDYIVSDSYGGMERMTELLLRSGCRKLKFVGTPEATGSIMDRYLGFCKALEKWGIEQKAEDVICDRIPDGYDFRLKVDIPEELPDGFVCNCDKSAIILIRKLLERGVKIPDEVSIVSFDHYYSDVIPGIELTTYENDRKALAQISVNTLLKRIDNRKESSGVRIVEGKIVCGNTVKQL